HRPRLRHRHRRGPARSHPERPQGHRGLPGGADGRVSDAATSGPDPRTMRAALPYTGMSALTSKRLNAHDTASTSNPATAVTIPQPAKYAAHTERMPLQATIVPAATMPPPTTLSASRA